MIQDALRKVGENESLSVEEAMAVAEEMMTGEATPAQIAGFLVALRMKGESVEEITGMAKVMREKALRVSTDGEVLDVVGWRRSQQHVQHLDGRGACGGGRRRCGCQARQSRSLQRERCGGRA